MSDAQLHGNVTGETEAEPFYWYKEYWLHQIYWEGVEVSLKRHRKDVPYVEADGRGEASSGNPTLFYWKTIYSLNDDCTLPAPKLNVSGKRLFGKVDHESPVYDPVVEVLYDGSQWRLFACRNFNLGDAILFIPEFEKESGESILGGKFARISDNLAACNTYVTSNRTLRCVQAVNKGDEIVRCSEGLRVLQHLEDIDRVIISMKDLSVGRIGLRFAHGGDRSLVHFPDTGVDVARKFHLLVSMNRMV